MPKNRRHMRLHAASLNALAVAEALTGELAVKQRLHQRGEAIGGRPRSRARLSRLPLGPLRGHETDVSGRGLPSFTSPLFFVLIGALATPADAPQAASRVGSSMISREMPDARRGDSRRALAGELTRDGGMPRRPNSDLSRTSIGSPRLYRARRTSIRATTHCVLIQRAAVRNRFARQR